MVGVTQHYFTSLLFPLPCPVLSGNVEGLHPCMAMRWGCNWCDSKGGRMVSEGTKGTGARGDYVQAAPPAPHNATGGSRTAGLANRWVGEGEATAQQPRSWLFGEVQIKAKAAVDVMASAN